MYQGGFGLEEEVFLGVLRLGEEVYLGEVYMKSLMLRSSRAFFGGGGLRGL